MQFGFTFDSTLVIGILRIYWLGAELLSPTNQLDFGNKFGSKYAASLRKRHQGYGDTFFIDEVLIKIDGKQRYLWRAVDQDGEVVDVFLQERCQIWSKLIHLRCSSK